MISRIVNIISLLAVMFAFLVFLPCAVMAQDEVARTPEEILTEAGEIPTAEAIRELFINCSAWDELHEPVKVSSKEALIELGALAVPTLMDYLPSTNVLKRVTLDEIITAIGHPAAEYLIPHLQDEEGRVRRHAAYLLGDTAAINALEDPTALGPLEEDLPAIEALAAALEVETDWHSTASILGAIGKMRDPEQIMVLEGYLDDEEQALRLAAVVALGRIPDQEVVRPLIHAFADPLMNVRQAAVLALSTETNGNLAFEALVGSVGLHASGLTGRLCAIESLTRYLSIVESSDSNRVEEQRKRAFDLTTDLLSNNNDPDIWQVRGYACMLTAYTYDEEAVALLEGLSETEEHPFVIGKIEEAIDILEQGRPVAEETE